MTMETIMNCFAQYGGIAIFVIVFLEYLNLPGFPAGVIMPLAGIWAAGGKISFVTALLITVAAGLLGSLLLYALGYCGGEAFLKSYFKHFPGQRKLIEEKILWVREKGSVGIFVSKLLPMVRTLISIPAGVCRMKLWKYTVSSTLGILLWNLFFVGAGYFFGDTVLTYL